jgi:cyanophycinase-like exopeptidase
LIGIDERTTLAHNTNGNWEVFGLGSITLYKPGQEIAHYAAGNIFAL